MPRRSLLEIYASILGAVSKGIVKPTRIMYRANLSWLPLQRYLYTLLKKGFLEELKAKKRKEYKITESGRRFLNHVELAKNEFAQGGIEVPAETVTKKVKIKKGSQ